MRFIILILFVSSVLAEEKATKADDKKTETTNVNPVEESKSKTEKRDSSVQTSSFGINSNAEPFKPMLNPPVKYEVAASTNQQVYYGNKNPVVTAGNAKNGGNSQTANAFRGQYSQVASQPQQQPPQQQPLLNKNVKNAGSQQQPVQQQILYAVPQSPPNHYERVSQQPALQQQPTHQLPVQRGQQKQAQYVIAIPLSYLRQLQQQLAPHPQHQQQEQPSSLQIYKGQQQQFQLQPQQQQQTIYSIAGPLARDHQGAYRPFHRFALTPVNDVSTASIQHHQIGSPAPIPAPALAAAPAPPGYVTQYVQIPASVLMAALQSAQVQPQQRPVHLAQPVYPQQHPQQHFQQQQQLQPQVQYQQPIPQQQQHQHIQSPASQIFYLQNHPQQQLQPPQALTAPSPVYAYHVNPLQQQQQLLQQPSQQHQQYVAEQPQQLNVGKQSLRVRGIASQVNLAPTQYDTSPAVYEQAHPPNYSNAHGQQYIAQDPIAQPAQSHQVVQAQQLQSPDTYEQVIHHHFSPQQHSVQQPQQQLRQSYQPQQHRFQAQSPSPQPPSSSQPPPPSPSAPSASSPQQQPQHSPPYVDHLNNLQFSQGIQGPTPLPYLGFHPPSAVAPYYNFNVVPPTFPQPFATSALHPPFTPLGVPNKVASFTNVVFQPFGGHASPLHVQEINSAIGGNADTVPYYHQAGGVRYGTHVLHPPTSAATYLAGGKPTVVTHSSPRVNEQKISASSAKSSVTANPTLVKYP